VSSLEGLFDFRDGQTANEKFKYFLRWLATYWTSFGRYDKDEVMKEKQEGNIPLNDDPRFGGADEAAEGAEFALAGELPPGVKLPAVRCCVHQAPKQNKEKTHEKHGYLLFYQTQKKRVLEEHPQATARGEITRLVSAEWRALTPDERQRYTEHTTFALTPPPQEQATRPHNRRKKGLPPAPEPC
jgi:hypothetical protein